MAKSASNHRLERAYSKCPRWNIQQQVRHLEKWYFWQIYWRPEIIM
jgi:hypothetical protein